MTDEYKQALRKKIDDAEYQVWLRSNTWADQTIPTTPWGVALRDAVLLLRGLADVEHVVVSEPEEDTNGDH
jgi:hypothetical protein